MGLHSFPFFGLQKNLHPLGEVPFGELVAYYTT